MSNYKPEESHIFVGTVESFLNLINKPAGLSVSL